MRNIREVLLFLNIIRFSNKKALKLLEKGLLDNLINYKKDKFINFDFLTDKEQALIENKIEKFNIEEELNKLHKFNIKYITIIDQNYPERLKNIFNPPSILYYKGKKFDIFTNPLAIVGTRKVTNYGIWVLKKIISELNKYDIQIVSGMATGIDFHAHNESINNNIATIGVLASSLEYEYPKSNYHLYRKMENELLISEFPLNTPPLKLNFVLRNRIISGLSFGTLVIESAEKSGSLITANYAIEQGREVYTIPGNINQLYSKGCNALLKKGANLVESASDIIEELAFINEVNKINIYVQKFNLGENEIKILEILRENFLTVDEIAYETKIELKDLYAILTKLEFYDIIKSEDNKFILY